MTAKARMRCAQLDRRRPLPRWLKHAEKNDLINEREEEEGRGEDADRCVDTKWEKNAASTGT